MTKTCKDCGIEKPIERFHKCHNKGRGKAYRMGICGDCRSIRRRSNDRERERDRITKAKRYAEDPEYRRNILSIQHKWRYGITLDEKDELLAAQGGVCAVCGTDEPGERGWSTDHDHACCPGMRSCGDCIRGLLCKRCNFALGHFDDDVVKLQGAIDYLLRGRSA